MVEPRERMARRKANELLREAQVATLPVDPFALATSKKIELLERKLPEGIYGACGYHQSRFVILISTECPTPAHRRFTAAHELGHYHMDDHLTKMFGQGERWVHSKGAHFQGRTDSVEREADFFANELLMPEQLLKPYLKGQPGLRQVKGLVSACDVSMTSASITMARLTGDPLLVVASKDGMVEWVSMSPSLKAYPWAKEGIRGEICPPRSRTKKLSNDSSAVAECRELDGEAVLCEWLPKAPAGIRATEEAIGLGRYGRVLTILKPDYLPDVDQEQERSWRDQGDTFRGRNESY